MKEKNIFGRILDSLAPLFEKIPNGLVVFFPSKAFLNSFLTTIKTENSKNFQALVRFYNCFVLTLHFRNFEVILSKVQMMMFGKNIQKRQKETKQHFLLLLVENFLKVCYF